MKDNNKIDLFNKSVLCELDKVSYYNIIQFVIDHLTGKVNLNIENYRPHELSFAQFSLLVCSVLGNFCWEGAFQDISKLKYGDVEHIFTQKPPSDYLFIVRKNLRYPITVHYYVIYALENLVAIRMQRNKTKNNGLSQLLQEDILAPLKPGCRNEVSKIQYNYHLELVSTYLQIISKYLSIEPVPNIDSFIGVGRYLIHFNYDLDVLYSTLGVIPTGLVTKEQLSDPLFLQKFLDPVFIEGIKN
jgi:hypothetical protein